jgi:xanthine/CO dehydrogenase XdhC/CoxF family maturation factor
MRGRSFEFLAVRERRIVSGPTAHSQGRLSGGGVSVLAEALDWSTRVQLKRVADRGALV